MPNRFVTVGDYARQVYPRHRVSGGDELCADGHAVVALYTEPGKAARVLETAGHEFGHLELALVRLDVRHDVDAPPRRASRTPMTIDELFDDADEPPAWMGVVAVVGVVALALVALQLLVPTFGFTVALVCALGGATLGSITGFAIARHVNQLRRWHRHDHEPQPMALAAVRAVGQAATAGVVALMERFEPESVHIVGADGWRLPERSERDRHRT